MSSRKSRRPPPAADLAVLDARCGRLIEGTAVHIAQTQEHVFRSAERIKRQQQRGFECDEILLRACQTVPELIDGETLDGPGTAMLLNEVEGCSHCGSRHKALVALVRFPALGEEMALCGECFQDLSDLALGQVT